MKIKYYLRGFGAGVIFATIILMITFALDKTTKKINVASSGNILDNNDVETTDSTFAENNTTVEKTSTEEKSTEGLTPEKTSTEEKSTEGATPEKTSTEEKSTEGASTEGTTTEEETTMEETTMEETTKIQEVNSEQNQNEIVQFTVTEGMISNIAAEQLEELGVIEDWEDFNTYLCDNGYESNLRIGVYEIKKGESYEKIAQIITGR